MKVTLTVKQRIDLQSILPKEGDYTTIKMVRVLRESLSFNQEEHDKLKFVTKSNGGIEWDGTKADECTKEINIPEVIVSQIKKILETANTSKKMRETHIDFWEMFMLPDEPKSEAQNE
jgi:hypothetical protein